MKSLHILFLLGLFSAAGGTAQPAWVDDSVLVASTRAPLQAAIKTILNADVKKLVEWQNAGRSLADWSQNIDKHDLDLTGFKPEEVRFLKELITHVQTYKRAMVLAYTFVGDTEPGKSYKEKGRAYGEKIPWEEADDNYRTIVNAELATPCKPTNPQEDCSLFVHHYADYADALLQKAAVAAALFGFMKVEGDYSSDVLKRVIQYGLDAAAQVYAHVPGEYVDDNYLERRDKVIASLQDQMSKLGA